MNYLLKTVLVEKIEEVELSKLLENLYRAINIGLVNEMKIICKTLNIDIFNTINAAATKNFGFQKFLPGLDLVDTVYQLILSIYLGSQKKRI